MKLFCKFPFKKLFEGTSEQYKTIVEGLAFVARVWAKFCQPSAKNPGWCFLFLELPWHFLTGAERAFSMFLEVLEAVALHLWQGLSINKQTVETNFFRLRKIIEHYIQIS